MAEGGGTGPGPCDCTRLRQVWVGELRAFKQSWHSTAPHLRTFSLWSILHVTRSASVLARMGLIFLCSPLFLYRAHSHVFFFLLSILSASRIPLRASSCSHCFFNARKEAARATPPA
ncbi:AAA family ATPase-like protein [Leishmania donovani]|uniref:AAA family ATPase-like protein n=1 Tax=Leishmania donovani TaxID=5661 RepID=E9BLZ5_LEIDO|nr:AAA family ATPase-like protein [Leishmania donovani]CBZ36273.1 AAA family ATPase-like protein [Leishmania donovani]